MDVGVVSIPVIEPRSKARIVAIREVVELRSRRPCSGDKTLVPKFAGFATGRFKRAAEIEPPGIELTAGGDGVSRIIEISSPN